MPLVPKRSLSCCSFKGLSFSLGFQNGRIKQFRWLGDIPYQGFKLVSENFFVSKTTLTYHNQRLLKFTVGKSVNTVFMIDDFTHVRFLKQFRNNSYVSAKFEKFKVEYQAILIWLELPINFV